TPLTEAGDVGLRVVVERGVELDTEDAAEGLLGGDEESATLAGADVDEGVLRGVADGDVAEGGADVGGARRAIGFAVGELADEVGGWLLDVAGGGDVARGVEPPLLKGADGGADAEGVGSVFGWGEGHAASLRQYALTGS